jgi:hypothetical protein
MEQYLYPPGTLVQVISYSPFRGLRGTIAVVDSISDDADEPFCFYLIMLEGTQLKCCITSQNSFDYPNRLDLSHVTKDCAALLFFAA